MKTVNEHVIEFQYNNVTQHDVDSPEQRWVTLFVINKEEKAFFSVEMEIEPLLLGIISCTHTHTHKHYMHIYMRVSMCVLRRKKAA